MRRRRTAALLADVQTLRQPITPANALEVALVPGPTQADREEAFCDNDMELLALMASWERRQKWIRLADRLSPPIIRQPEKTYV